MANDRIIMNPKNSGSIKFKVKDAGGVISTPLQMSSTGITDGSGNPIGSDVVQTPSIVANAVTINWSLGSIVKLDLHGNTGDLTPTFSNPIVKASYILEITQGAGLWYISWPQNFLFDSASDGVPSQAADALDLITITYDGVNYICSMKKNVVATTQTYNDIYGWGRWGGYGSFGNGVINGNKSIPVLAQTFGHSFVEIKSGSSSSLGRKANGEIWSWGTNDYGTFGNGNTGTQKSPVLAIGNHTFTSASLMWETVVALKADGSAWGWGRDGGNGNIGDGTAVSKSSPVSVVGGHSFIKAVSGVFHTVALKADGTVWGWGSNGNGQLGNNTTDGKSSPVQVVGTGSFTEIQAGEYHTVALKADGTVWAWGRNTYGNLGDNTIVDKSSPVSVVGNHSFVQLRHASHALALKADGSIWAWGYNGSGRLGLNDTLNRSSPVSVVGNHSFVEVSVHDTMSFARKADGSAWAWGYNNYGQLGDSTIVDKSSPVSVVGSSFVQIEPGQNNTVARKANGEIWSWGFNSTAQLGLTAECYYAPVQMPHLPRELNMVKGSYHTAQLRSNGTVWMWGDNSNGALGDNTVTAKSSPVSVVGNHSFVEIVTGDYHTCGRKVDGSLWSWGDGGNGRLGDNSTVAKSSPVSVVGNHIFVQIAAGVVAYTLGRKGDGSVWAWGYNNSGCLGLNDITPRSSPVSVVGNHSFITIGSGYEHNIALKADGSAWGWGVNNGCLGDNSTVAKSSPVSVVGNHSFVEIAVGYGYTHARKADGSVWAWGGNASGMLGDSTIVDKSSPVSVVGGHSFINITTFLTTTDSGAIHGLKADGSVWGWGKNNVGQLGDTTLISKSSPVSVAGVIARKLFPGGFLAK
jgi:alpha-tubulin suppressor-like RCC1 family protein